MLKKSLVALAVVVAAAVAAPAFAATDPVFGTSTPDQLDLYKGVTLHELQQRGVNATDVAAWGNYVRADVTLPNGAHAVRFFEPFTLQPVDINRVN